MLSSQNPYSPERIDALTKTLSTMDPRARQQYAAQHKNDPAVIAVALNVNNILRAAENSKAMQAGSQQQPKVVDQEIAGMAPPPQQMMSLPEDQGIARLPAPNMQNMADGGIAGYDDGGMTGASEFDYAQRSEPVVRMADGGHVPRYQVGGSLIGDIPGFQAVQPRAQFTQEGSPENQTLWERMSASLRESGLQRQLAMIEQKIARGKASPEEQVFYDTQKAKLANMPPPTGAPKPVMNPDDAAMAAEKAARFQAAVGTGAGAGTPPPGATPERPQAALPTGLASIAQAKRASDELFDAAGLERKVEQQRMQERQDVANQREERAAKQAEFREKQGPAYAGYEKLLKSEELQDTTDKEKAGLTALFKGFLAVAAGASPNAATNIAKGAMAGMEDYSGAMKEFKKAAKERNKAMADIENARRAEEKGDFKDQQTFEDRAADRLAAADRFATDAVINITGKKSEAAGSIYKEMLQQSGANTRTNAQIAAGRGPGQQEHLFKTLGGGDVTKGLGVYASTMGPEAKGEQALLAKYAGPQGQIALQMLENSGPEGKAQAQIIRQALKQSTTSLLKPVNVANALP
jgi:hypothetical protein